MRTRVREAVSTAAYADVQPALLARYLNINDWGDAVRDDTIEALGALNDVLNEAIDQRSDLQVSMVRSASVTCAGTCRVKSWFAGSADSVVLVSRRS